MKLSRTPATAAAKLLIALAFLLASGAAQALPTAFPAGEENALGIRNLDVDGTLYNVVFLQDTAESIYGDEPGIYDFATAEDAEDAMQAVNEALDAAFATSVGPAYSIVYEIPYDFENDFVAVREAVFLDIENVNLGTPAWLQRTDSQLRPFRIPKTYAVFSVVPEPGTALLVGLGLAGLGVAGRSRRPAHIRKGAVK